MILGKEFISICRTEVISGHGEHFIVGEEVEHQEKDAGTAIILSFAIDERTQEVIVNTSKGFAHLAFINKIK